jgi:hypothetical protein
LVSPRLVGWLTAAAADITVAEMFRHREGKSQEKTHWGLSVLQSKMSKMRRHSGLQKPKQLYSTSYVKRLEYCRQTNMGRKAARNGPSRKAMHLDLASTHV